MIEVFGLKTQQLETYTFHNYDTSLIYFQFIPDFLLKQFIQGYYGIDESSFELTFIQEQPQITIRENYKKITDLDRQTMLGYYISMSQFIFQYCPFIKAFECSLKARIFYGVNPIKQEDYMKIFNQIFIGPLGIEDICVRAVKFGRYAKGKTFYPIDFYENLDTYSEEGLLIQYMTCDSLITNVFYMDQFICTQQLIMSDISYDPFGLLKEQPSKKQEQIFQIQLQYNKPVNELIKQIKQLKQFAYRKSHGHSYKLQGIKLTEGSIPQIRITFFPSTTYAHIECRSSDIFTAQFNFTLLQNYFQLEDPNAHIYNEDGSVKKEFVKKKMRMFQQEEEQIQKINLEGIGTDKFNIKQQPFTMQSSELHDLKLIDPINYGEDDRYKYENLVNDIQKRPIQISKNQFETMEQQILKNLPKIKQEKNKNIVGAGKGTPVYNNIKHNDEVQMLKIQQQLSIVGFSLRNATFPGILNYFKCSQQFPYLNLAQTKGKDSISCIIDPLNYNGLSIYEFYDSAQRILRDLDIINFFRKQLYGKVTIATIKFTEWIVPGRCSELSIELKKLFNDNLILLSPLLQQRNQFVLDEEQLKNIKMDEVWFESVFGKKYEDLYDTNVIYAYSEKKYYIQKLKKISNKVALWIQFDNHKKYLFIKEEITITEDQNKHYFTPYFFEKKIFEKKKKYNVQYYKDLGFHPLYYTEIQHRYLVCKEGMVPFYGNTVNYQIDFKQYNRFIPPKYEKIKKIIQDTDNYFINYNEKIIGTKYEDLFFYWEETFFETKISFVRQTYPLQVLIDDNKLDTIHPSLNPFFAYYIVQWIKYHDDDRKKEALEEILKDKKKLKQILTTYRKIVDKNQFASSVYYCNELCPLLTTITEKEIDQIDDLIKILPDDLELKFDFIVGVSQNNSFVQYAYDKNNNEEIHFLGKVKKNQIYQ